jgi:hypothetical protein
VLALTLRIGATAMDALLLQDWVTLQTGGNPASLTQSAACYLDVSDYHDLVFFIDASEMSQPANPIIQYQTAPVAEDSLFVPMLSLPSSFTGGVRADVILGSYALVPPARYVRWKCLGSYAWQCTFRIWVAGSRLQ